MRIFEFFAGTGSATQAFEEAGHEVYRFELDPQFDATEHVDINDLTAEYLLATYGKPDFIWASPPCTTFSVASLTHHWQTATECRTCGGEVFRRDTRGWAHTDTESDCERPVARSDRIVQTPVSEAAERGLVMLQHTLQLIDELDPRWWAVENPRAMMRKRPELAEVKRHTITHCQYGDPRRMKPTDLFGVLPDGFVAKACKNGDDCHVAAPRGARTGTQGLNSRDAAMLPPMLGIELLQAMEG